jgi:hypothetical protein
MTVSTLGRTVAILALCARGQSTQLASIGVASGSGRAQSAARNATDPHLITAFAMGHVRLGASLEEARRALPTASFRRTSDGDGTALVEISLGKDDSLTVWADEHDEAAPIEWSRTIVSIEVFSAAFHTGEGVHPGSLVTEAVEFFGPVREIVQSEIEAREYITFERQPRELTFRLDYTGIFRPGSRRTTHFAPTAKIWSIAISSLP